MDLNKPEEFTFEAELLLFQPLTPSMCNILVYYVLKILQNQKWVAVW